MAKRNYDTNAIDDGDQEDPEDRNDSWEEEDTSVEDAAATESRPTSEEETAKQQEKSAYWIEEVVKLQSATGSDLIKTLFNAGAATLNGSDGLALTVRCAMPGNETTEVFALVPLVNFAGLTPKAVSKFAADNDPLREAKTALKKVKAKNPQLTQEQLAALFLSL